MPLSFPDRVRLAMSYAERVPGAIVATKPAKGDEVTAFVIGLPHLEITLQARVERRDDKATVHFFGDEKPIDKGEIHRKHAGWDQIERVRALANKQPPAVEDNGLGATLDTVLAGL